MNRKWGFNQTKPLLGRRDNGGITESYRRVFGELSGNRDDMLEPFLAFAAISPLNPVSAVIAFFTMAGIVVA